MNGNSDIQRVITAEHNFVCIACSKSAGKVQLRPGEILLWDPYSLGAAINARDEERLLTAVTAGDARALYAVNPEFAPFFCPRCNTCYCEEHWKQKECFEEDGWFDCIRGTCPRGHKRILQD